MGTLKTHTRHAPHRDARLSWTGTWGQQLVPFKDYDREIPGGKLVQHEHAFPIPPRGRPDVMDAYWGNSCDVTLKTEGEVGTGFLNKQKGGTGAQPGEPNAWCNYDGGGVTVVVGSDPELAVWDVALMAAKIALAAENEAGLIPREYGFNPEGLCEGVPYDYGLRPSSESHSCSTNGKDICWLIHRPDCNMDPTATLKDVIAANDGADLDGLKITMMFQCDQWAKGEGGGGGDCCVVS